MSTRGPKRTRRLTLTTLMATGSVNIAACTERAPDPLTWEDQFPATSAATAAAAAPEVEAVAYADPAACKAAGEVPAPDCDNGWIAAQNDHATNAPRYGDKAACEAEYGEGRCETRTSGGGSFFVPFLAGMMLGNMGGGRYQPAPYYRNRRGLFSTPYGGGLYRDTTTGRLRAPLSTLDRRYAGSGGSAAGGASPYGSAAATRPATRERAVSRGGFRNTRSYAGRGYGG
ncbi:MAG TPA: DUF1190 domain-containing protein [Caulobacteraceae bacterium]